MTVTFTAPQSRPSKPLEPKPDASGAEQLEELRTPPLAAKQRVLTQPPEKAAVAACFGQT